MKDLKNGVCRIDVFFSDHQKAQGTGFFISDGLILTCNHIFIHLIKVESIKFSVNSDSENTFEAVLLATDEEVDYALLKVIDSNFIPPKILNLVSFELKEGDNLNLFGYPFQNETQERTTGVNIHTSINTMNNCFNVDVKHDIVLNSNPSYSVDYAGVSGAPLYNNNNDVVGIFKRQDAFTIGGISIKRATQFLIKNGIYFSNINNLKFEDYQNDIFKHFNSDVINDCETELIKVIKDVNPLNIIKEKMDDLFYPPKEIKSFDEIIQYIQSNAECCPTTFWKGWLELLTYVRVIKGDYSNLSNINFTLNNLDFKELFRLNDNDHLNEKPLLGNLKFTLSFFFVEDKCFFDVAKETLRSNIDSNINVCTVFNSNQRNFSHRKLTREQKHKIITNVADPLNSGFHIPEKIHLGVLPLIELSDKVANSSSLEDANINLIKLFEDAIK